MAESASRYSGRSGIVFILSAPSGAGKTTLVRALTGADSRICVSVSHTTRPPRPDEVEGEAYFFVDTAEFDRIAEAGEFLEHARVFDHQYGTSNLWVQERLAEGTDVILEIDWQGARQVRHLLPGAVSIFILPPSLRILRQRLEKRGDGEAVTARRMRDAATEISHYREYDYLISNELVEQALADLAAVVHAARCGYATQRQYLDTVVDALLQEAEAIR